MNVDAFRRDGAMPVRGVLSEEHVALLAAGVDRVQAEPGDLVAFHMLTLHAAAGSRTRRRAFSVRMIGDDVTYAPRPHRTSPPFSGLDLPAGAPMDDPLFPVLWTC